MMVVLAGVVIVAGLILLLPLVLDPNDYKAKISDLVYDKSGYRLEIPGKIGLQVTPGLDFLFSLGQVRVLSGPDFPDAILLASEEARVELALWPLLREKRLQLQGVRLHGVYCNLIRDRAGKGNWELPAPAPVAVPGPQSKKAAPPQQQAAAREKRVPGLDLGSLKLSRITVRYEDQQAGKIVELKELSVDTGRVQDGLPFHLQSTFILASSGSGNSVLSMESKLETEVVFSLAGKTVQFDKFSLVNRINAFGMQETAFKLAGSGSLDLQQRKVVTDGLTLASGDLSLVVRAEVSDFAGPVFQGTLQVPECSLREFLEQNNFGQPAWKDDSALRQFGLSLGFQGEGKTITVTDIQALLDGAHAQGSLVLVDPAHPAYDLKMHLDRLDLDRYAILPPQSATPSPPSTKEESRGATSKVSAQKVSVQKAASLQPLFPVELIKGLDFHLDMTADSMKSSGVELSRVKLKAQGKDGLVELKPFQAELYSGTVSAEATLDVRGNTPRMVLKKELDHVHVAPLLRDMTGREELSGIAVLSLQLTSSGNSREAIVRHANGKLQLALQDGEIKRLRILKVIRQAKALYKGEQVVHAAVDEPTAFAHISASGLIKEGIFYNDDLKANSDLMKVTGKGEVDFADEQVDYLLNIYLSRGLDRDERSGKAEYSRDPVPYRIKGKFSELKEEADVVGLLKSQAQNLLMKELQKQLNKGDEGEKQGEKKDTTQQLLEKGLKSLFGN